MSWEMDERMWLLKSGIWLWRRGGLSIDIVMTRSRHLLWRFSRRNDWGWMQWKHGWKTEEDLYWRDSRPDANGNFSSSYKSSKAKIWFPAVTTWTFLTFLLSLSLAVREGTAKVLRKIPSTPVSLSPFTYCQMPSPVLHSELQVAPHTKHSM